MDRQKNLEMAVSQIEKQYGKGSIMRMGEKGTMAIEAVPTGALALDLALGVGGLPRGRITEIYGPESSGKSTLAMHVVAEAQRNGGICAYVDAEHALDPVYAKAIGVDIDELLISQPDTGEQALEIADMLVRSGAIDVVVIDSVAALTPKAEIEGEMGDAHVGLQARLMSQALRKLTANLNKSDTIAVFINQLREKIGVMFGCCSSNTRVTLADGSQEEIGKIVNQKLPVEVLTYDHERGEIVPRPVTNWFDNGRTDRFLTFTVAKPSGNGRSQFACTPNHKVMTPGGWREAQELQVGDRVLQSVTHRLSDFQWQVVLGGLMGDGALSPSRSGHAARFRWGHGAKQVAYGDWKASLFANVGVSRSTNTKGAVFHDVQPLPELAELRRAVYVGDKKVFSDDYLKRLTPLSLAVWYMDDGSFALRSQGKQARTEGGSGRAEICVEAMEPTTRQRVRDFLADTWGIDAKLTARGKGQKVVLQFSRAETDKLHALVAPFVHPSMDYKLLPRFRGQFAVEPVFAPERHELMPLPITKIGVRPPSRSTHRFDIEVAGTHNYFADGVMVHNSPETTPGGRALKFYSSVRLDIRRIESIKEGVEVIGNRTRVKVVKNKCFAAGTTVFDPESGLTHRIEDIVERGEGSSVVAADKLGQLQVRPIVQRFDQGEAECVGLKLGDGTELWVTPDHKVLTDTGWREAGEIAVGDRVARPRQFLGFGDAEPVPPDHARLLGYLIGDGCVTGKTPVSFTNVEPTLQSDAKAIASSLGCDAHPRGTQVSFSYRKGKTNGILELARWAGIYGHTAPEKRIPAAFFAADISAEVVANLVFGIWESDGHVSREQTGGVRVGFTTTSEQLARQLHWLLLRWGIGSSVRVYDPKRKRPSLIDGRRVQGKLPCWEVRISGIDNVTRFAEALPMWGPRGRVLTEALADPSLAKHRGSQRGYLPANATEPVLAYLWGRGITPALAAQLVGDGAGNPRGGLKQVLGVSRLRRDRIGRLADALDSDFLRNILGEEVWYDKVMAVLERQWRPVYDVEVDEDHTLVAHGVIASNCAPPFKNAEFDIMYGKGISREGSLLDIGVDLGLVKKSGAWYTYDGEQLGQGRENAKQFLAEHAEVMVEISERIRSQLGIGGAGKSDDGSGDEAGGASGNGAVTGAAAAGE
ncbi:MAG TPA: recombinase RecA [Acidimicrobiales bacterium]|nr:recombinase RecA [Acidimicrobiales bacterium]